MPQSPYQNNSVIREREALKKKGAVHTISNLEKSAGFYTFFSTPSMDYQLSVNEKYMKKEIYERRDGTLMKKESRLYSLVENPLELEQFRNSARWKKIQPDCDVYQGNKYVLYFRVSNAGKNTGCYKVVKLEKYQRGRWEPEVIRFYKKMGTGSDKVL